MLTVIYFLVYIYVPLELSAFFNTIMLNNHVDKFLSLIVMTMNSLAFKASICKINVCEFGHIEKF